MGARRILAVCVSAASLAGLGSCTALPDTSGYTAASFQLKSAATAAGSALQTELGRTAETLPAQHQARARELATRFEAAWGKTVSSLDGLARYAESIEELTKAGNNGGESARGVAKSVSDLAGAVGFVPGAEFVGVATDTVVLLNSAIANIRASRSLERSLELADPVIGDMSGLIGRQVATARQQFAQTVELERNALDFSVDDIAPLDAQLAALEKEAARTLAARSTGASSEAQRGAAAADFERIRSGRAALAPRMEAYHAAQAALAQRQKTGEELFAATEMALATWRESHGKVVRAIRERRPVSFESLSAASEDIRSLIGRWRDL